MSAKEAAASEPGAAPEGRRPGPLVRFARRRLIPLARHPATGVVAGIILVVGGLIELVEDLLLTFDTGIGFHHSGILFGLFVAMRGIAEMAEGISWLAIKEELEAEAEAREAISSRTDDG